MSEAIDKLRWDLTVLEAMAAEMDEYLRSDVLFWPLMNASLPRLTLGGYLMRQQRLLTLKHLLDADESDRLESAVRQFNEALVEKIVRFEERAHQELRARLRQWSENLKDIARESSGYGNHYASAVEVRAMIDALLNKLEMPPYQLDKTVRQQLSVYDKLLRSQWSSGDFVWPEAWQAAYPQGSYWWLYGRPRS